MRSRGRRILAGIGWVIGSMIAWILVFNIMVISCYLVTKRFASLGVLRDWLDILMLPVAYAGFVLVPTAATMLALRSKLPWTGDGLTAPSPGGLRGFPVGSLHQPDRDQ